MKSLPIPLIPLFKIQWAFFGLICLLIAFQSNSLFAQSMQKKGTVIQQVTVISSERETPLESAFVVIENEQIVSVGISPPNLNQAEYNIVDGRGKYLIPGLIDSHVHLYNIPGLNAQQERQKQMLVEAYQRQLPRSYLYFGYTTLIELGAKPEVSAKIKQMPLHPDIYDCHTGLVLSDGFGVSESSSEEALENHSNFLYDHHRGNSLPSKYDKSAHTPKATVQKTMDEGGICVKTYYEDGFGGTVKVGWEHPTTAIIREVVQESQKQKLPVVIHANSLESQKFALEAGVDMIGHGMWHWGTFKQGEAPVQALLPEVQEVLDQIVKEQIGYMPTTRTLNAQSAMFDPNFLDDQELTHVLPSELLQWMKSEEGQEVKRRFVERFAPGLSDSIILQEMNKFQTKLALVVEYLGARKANLLLGSDSVVGSGIGNPPGYNGYLEMQAWAKAGVSLKQIFQAATLNNAKAFLLDKQVGTVEVGKQANLLLLRENPWQTLEAYNSIESVMIRGKMVQRQQLSATHEEPDHSDTLFPTID